MTQQELEEQSKKAVIAYLRDSSVRLERRVKGIDPWATLKKNPSLFDFDDYDYRIAQPKPWYRVALMEGNRPALAISNSGLDIEPRWENHKTFIKWLTNRIEYEQD